MLSLQHCSLCESGGIKGHPYHIGRMGRLKHLTNVRTLRMVSAFTRPSPSVGVSGVYQVWKNLTCIGCVEAEPWLLVNYTVVNYYDGEPAPLIRSSIRWTIHTLFRKYSPNNFGMMYVSENRKKKFKNKIQKFQNKKHNNSLAFIIFISLMCTCTGIAEAPHYLETWDQWSCIPTYYIFHTISFIYFIHITSFHCSLHIHFTRVFTRWRQLLVDISPHFDHSSFSTRPGLLHSDVSHTYT